MGRGGGGGGGGGVRYGGGCGLFAFDTKGPPFRWLAGPSAPSSTAPGPLSAGPVGVDWCPDDLFPCSHSGKGRSIQLLMSPWEPADPPTTSTPELATALTRHQQAGTSLAPITGWMRYPADQRPRSIPLWSVRWSQSPDRSISFGSLSVCPVSLPPSTTRATDSPMHVR
jgi:hypothetical protein